jgi:phage gpG-like protein
LGTRAVEVRIEFDGVERMSRMFPLLEKDIADMSDIFRDVEKAMLDEMSNVFDAEGPGWQALAPATIADRRAKGFAPGPILDRTGRLRASLDDAGDTDHIRDITPTTFVFGSRTPYAIFHQRGTSTIPQRQILQGSRLSPLVSRVFEDAIPAEVRRSIRNRL